MPFQVSPGVNVSEIDLTTAIPSVSTSVGAFAGRFQWGPALESTLVSSEVDLVDQFFKPAANTYEDFFTAANFLAYSGALRLVRVIDEDKARNAQEGAIHVATGEGLLIKNDTHFDSGLTFANTFYAKYAGAAGNELSIELCDYSGGLDGSGNEVGFTNWWVNTYFDAPPTTSAHVAARGGTNDELHVAVIDSTTGFFSGTANSVLEIYPFLSQASDARNSSGDLIHWKTHINNTSKYIRIGNETAKTKSTYGTSTAATTTFQNTATGIISAKLQGGSDGDYQAAEYSTAYDLFADTDQEDVSLIMAGGGGQGIIDTDKETVIKKAIDIATTRKDCVAFYSPLKSDTVDQATAAGRLTEVKGFRNTQTNKNTSYAFMDSGWKYQYDKYNAVYRWTPLNGDVAGLAARTDQQRDAWFSPAGYNRGQIKNVVKLAYNPSKAHRDELYSKQINPVVSFPGQGTLLFGDKTSQTRPSAFDRINVRRLFIVLEKAISTASKFSLFEFNDAFTRAQFRNMVEPFLRDVQGRRGITDFKVVCDETNNPGSVVDRNEFVGDIYVKPVRSINFIQLNFVAVSTGVDFTEVVGKF
jgi:phage tail sheath protein FI